MMKLLAVALLALAASAPIFAQTPFPGNTPWQPVEAAIGRPGQLQPDGVMKFGLPRSDMDVTVSGVKLKPVLALGGWVAFSKPGPDAMVMGDLVLAEGEITPVMTNLMQNGIEVTGIHNHVLHESPRVMYMHVGARGDATQIAKSLAEALALTKLPAPQKATTATGIDIGINTSQIDRVIGFQGKINGGVFQIGVPRAETITEHGIKLPNFMGLTTSLNFQPTGNGRAAITGDFVLLGSEVNPVIKVLRQNGIEVTAIHSHMLDEQPRLFFMHFWANDDAVKLAKGLSMALNETNSKKASR